MKDLAVEIQLDGQDKPRVEINPAAEALYRELFSELSKEGKHVIAVVRCWNKSAEQLQEVRERFDKMKKTMPELAGICIVVNGNENGDAINDDGESTITRTLEQNSPDTVPMLPLNVRGYTWSAGLNAPVALLNAASKKYGFNVENQQILNISFDSEFDEDSLRELSNRVRDGRPIATVRVDKMLVPSPSELQFGERVKAILKKQDVVTDDSALDPIVALGRNTGIILPLSDIVALGGYNEQTNRIGGMEDHEFAARYIIGLCRAIDEAKVAGNAEEQGRLMRKLIEVTKAIRNPIAYSDSAWNAMSVEQQQAKALREKGALDGIADLVEQRFVQDPATSAARLEKDKQDFVL